MTAYCKEGHASTESDYCSVCGAPMDGSQVAVASAPAHAPGTCPACGEPRTDPSARFCEVCRYDFVARKAGPPPAAAPGKAAAPSPSPSPALVPAPAPSNPAVLWDVVIAVDPSLDTDPDPNSPCPTDEPEHVFPLDISEMLIGRRDDRRDIRPEIPVSDPGTSRRHAKLVRNADGTVSLLDLASMNGTRLNGADVPPGSRTVLTERDQVAIGRWTSIRLRRRS